MVGWAWMDALQGALAEAERMGNGEQKSCERMNELYV